MNPRRLRRICALTLAATLLAAACTPSSATIEIPPPSPPPPLAERAPNVVLVLTDDQRADTLWAMPIVRRQLVAQGTKFHNGFVTNPICCPSRASILTGLYSHHNGVWVNGGKQGGFVAFSDTDTLATRLQDAGYHTGLIGKYLNHYNDASYIPPGWSSWQGLLAESEGKYFDYIVNDNGTPVHYGRAEDDYSTDVLMGLGTDFIEEAPKDQPLFLYLATKAPHGRATPAPRDRKTLKLGKIKFNDSWDEGNVDDKPQYIQDRKPLSLSQQFRFTNGLLDANRSLGAVDDGIGELLATLRETGRLQDTLFIFTSDNGTAWGEHRWAAKSVPYEETIRVPFVMRYDRFGPAADGAEAMALNIDFAPTILDFAGQSFDDLDGESLVPILRDPALPGRRDFLIEHMQFIRPIGKDEKVPSYCALRTKTRKLVVYATGEREFYDLIADPEEVHNLAAEPGSAAAMQDLMPRLIELCNPMPPGFPADVLV